MQISASLPVFSQPVWRLVGADDNNPTMPDPQPCLRHEKSFHHLELINPDLRKYCISVWVAGSLSRNNSPLPYTPEFEGRIPVSKLTWDGLHNVAKRSILGVLA